VKTKTLIFFFILLPIITFSQNRNSISFGLGLVSERFSDRNLGSLDFAGAGYEMGLAVCHKFNPKLTLKGSFSFKTSELSHQLSPITCSPYIPTTVLF
jgi:hypothetical protein